MHLLAEQACTYATPCIFCWSNCISDALNPIQSKLSRLQNCLSESHPWTGAQCLLCNTTYPPVLQPLNSVGQSYCCSVSSQHAPCIGYASFASSLLPFCIQAQHRDKQQLGQTEPTVQRIRINTFAVYVGAGQHQNSGDCVCMPAYGCTKAWPMCPRLGFAVSRWGGPISSHCWCSDDHYCGGLISGITRKQHAVECGLLLVSDVTSMPENTTSAGL